MSQPTFDPGSFFTFDLRGGQVATRGGRRVLVLTDTVLAPLVGAAVANGDLTVVRRLGRHIGEEVRASLGGSADDVPVDVVLGHLGGVLSLFGWGRIQLDRWGDALAVRVEHAPVIDAEQLALAALLGGLFSSVTGRDVACVPVGESAEFILVAPAIAETVWGWARAGENVAGIVARLAPEAELEGGQA
ncbi:MAG: hypothetical protein K1X94_23425 [Sandaracinaceae bacterium]|jgi:hypothetical protein|nr:hypothetical protein [Sandaracinaceae bacterium]